MDKQVILLTLVQHTTAEWNTSNEVLLATQFGLDTTTGALKRGDGSSKFNNLKTIATLTDLSNLQSTLETAIGKKADSTTVTSLTTTVGTKMDKSVLVTTNTNDNTKVPSAKVVYDLNAAMTTAVNAKASQADHNTLKGRVDKIADPTGASKYEVLMADGSGSTAWHDRAFYERTKAKRYGIRIAKNNSNPATRVEYILDAVGMTPAKMNFTTGEFDYGSWADAWFVTGNKPCMLKSNGTVDYFLDPNDYSKKEDGTDSDIENEEYDGNAMARIPLCWIKRYEDKDYEYEIVSNVKWDDSYKAYAHTRANGTIADYFYWSMFGGSGSATKIRSLSNKNLARRLNATQEVAGCKANGDLWYTHTWSQRECIRTLLILMGKSTNTQAVFGTGNLQGTGDNETYMLKTGTVIDKGQFWGSSANNQQVKVFHIEKFWGDQWDRTAGLINNKGPIYVKMTPEGEGYRITDVKGYENTGAVLAAGGYIKSMQCSEYGMIPLTGSGGSESTYYCDYSWTNNGQLNYLLCGESVVNATAPGGAFDITVNDAPSDTYWNRGCGLSCEQPA